MKTMRYMTALLAMGAIAAACSVKTTSTDDNDDGGTGGTGGTGAAVVASSTQVASSTVAASTVAASTVASSTTGGGMDQNAICDSGFALGGGADTKACADCLGASCCTEFTTCYADQNCNDCFIQQMGMGTACDAGDIDETVNSCISGSCGTECAALLP